MKTNIACVKLFDIMLVINHHHICRRTPTMIFVRESHVEKMGSVQDSSYEILNVLEFNRYVVAVIIFLSILSGNLLFSKVIHG